MKLGDCRHFNGIQNPRCRKDVSYDALPSPMPCLHDINQGPPIERCSSYESVTEADLAAREAKIEKSFRCMREGISSCCEAPLIDQHGRTRDQVGEVSGCVWFFCSKCKQATLKVQGRRRG